MAFWTARLARRALALLVAAMTLSGQGFQAGPQARGDRHYTVLLEAPASGTRLAGARGKAESRGPVRRMASSFAAMERSVERSQQPVIRSIRAQGVTVLGSVRNVLNAVFVRADPGQAEAIAGLPGVARVVQSREVPLRLGGVAQAVRLEEARSLAGDREATGEGVGIAVIDSGLDFQHPAFIEDSLPPLAGFPKGRPQHLEFANSKVIAIRTYHHLLCAPEPASSSPDDPSPWDFSGHGTAVAMVAAGSEVLSPDGAVSGIAPGAYLGIYKVTGSPDITPVASSQAIIAAIDDAVVDGMDILNLSAGHLAEYPWSSSGPECGLPADVLCDPLAAAAQSAVTEFGRVFVAAAGNDGIVGLGPSPTRGTISSPATAPDVIAVAATANAARLQESVGADGRTFPALSGSGPGLGAPVTAPAASAAWLENSEACDPFQAGDLEGQIVVARRGGCWFVDKVESATQAGAVGIVVYDDEPMESLIEMSSLANTDIPAYFVSAESGEEIVGLLDAATAESPVELTLDPTVIRSAADWRSAAEFSSRGPGPGLNLKPDIAAPGVGVYSAGAYQYERSGGFNPKEFRRFDGTSLAAPAVAGAAALVWQRHPHLTAREVASALVNTARAEVIEGGEPARVTTVGGGLLDVAAALDPIATVEPPTVGFGQLDTGRMPVWQDILITNRGTLAREYLVEVVPRDADSRAGVTLDGRSNVTLDLDPDQHATLRVLLAGRNPLPGAYEGHLRVRARGEDAELRVPYYYVVGDQVPTDAFSLWQTGLRGNAAELSQLSLGVRFVDRSGAPVRETPVEFLTASGEVSVVEADARTDALGVASALVEFGPSPGPHEVLAVAGGVELPFTLHSTREPPFIGAVFNSADPSSGLPVAPGSLVEISGWGLSEFPGEAPLSPLPVSLKSVSVSFDYPEAGLSEPGRVYSVGSDYVGVQVPWELAGFNFAIAKVRVMDRHGDFNVSEPVVVDLADVAPGLYSVSYGDGWSSASHLDGRLVTWDSPAAAGDRVVLELTGAGPFSEPLQSGLAFATSVPLAREVSVTIDGLPAQVTFSGSVPGVAGLAMVEAVVPAASRRGEVPVVVSVHGIASNPGVLVVR